MYRIILFLLVVIWVGSFLPSHALRQTAKSKWENREDWGNYFTTPGLYEMKPGETISFRGQQLVKTK